MYVSAKFILLGLFSLYIVIALHRGQGLQRYGRIVCVGESCRALDAKLARPLQSKGDCLLLVPLQFDSIYMTPAMGRGLDQIAHQPARLMGIRMKGIRRPPRKRLARLLSIIAIVRRVIYVRM